MAEELRAPFNGVPLTLIFGSANLGANSTAAATIVTGSASTTFDGILVPVGYKFKPLYLHLESNADLTAGTCTAKVTANNTAILNGPEPQLSDTVQANHAVARLNQSAGVAAGDYVGVHVIGSSLAPTTAEMDIVLVGVFERI
jgi:hypothetical protein